MAVKFAQKQVQDTAKAVAATQKPDLLKHEDTTVAVVIGEKVDRLWYLEQQLEPLKPVLKEFETIKKSLQSIATTEGAGHPNDPVRLDGDKAYIEYTPTTTTHEITDMQGLIGALKDRIGYPALLTILKINMSDVAKYLTLAEMEQFYKQVPGYRKMAIIAGKDEA